MDLLLDDVGAWLETQGVVGGSSGWTLCKGFMPPSTPNNPGQQLLGIFEVSGKTPDIIRDPTIKEQALFVTGLQVRGRGAINLANSGAYNALRTQMQRVYNALHQNEPPVPTSGDKNKYIYIYARTVGPLPMGRDETQRDEMSWNFDVGMVYEP